MKNIRAYPLKIYLMVLLVAIAWHATAQKCTCSDKLRFVKDQVTHNYAGFDDKVTAANQMQYEAFTTQLINRAMHTENQTACLALLQDWIDFFRDGHIQLVGNVVNDEDTAALNRWGKQRETIILPQERIKELERRKNGPEGIYTSADSNYTIAIVKSPNSYRDMAGVILSSKTGEWEPGQVKLELKKKDDKKYATIVHSVGHSRIREYVFADGRYNNDWIRTGNNNAEPALTDNVYAQKLNDKTLYLRLPGFDGWLAETIDSVVEANMTLLQTMPNLVIDLRGNAGGSDFSYRSLRQWLYTGPVVTAGLDVRATQDNIDGWKARVLGDASVPEEQKEVVKSLIERMQVNLGKYIKYVDDDTVTMDRIEPFPEKVVIIIDNECMSSAEQFLLVAKQSKKVVLMGEHTHGVLDYGNVRPSGQSSCGDILLFYATTKSRRLIKGQGIDNRGIAPDVVLPKNKDWVAEAVKYLDK